SPFSLSSSGYHLDLPSFPTRRSSDLLHRRAEARLRAGGPPRLRRAAPKRLTKKAPGASSRCLFASRRRAVRLRLPAAGAWVAARSEEHTSELQSRENLVCRLLLEKKK